VLEYLYEKNIGRLLQKQEVLEKDGVFPDGFLFHGYCLIAASLPVFRLPHSGHFTGNGRMRTTARKRWPQLWQMKKVLSPGAGGRMDRRIA
jgi:hypothetical protein